MNNVLTKQIKIFFCILCCIVMLLAVIILKHYDLMFRAWVVITFFVIVGLFWYVLCGYGEYILYIKFKTNKTLVQNTITVITIVGIAIIICGSAIFGFFFSIMVYQPEYVVEKHDQKMVAYVNSFLDVIVTYHEYKNFIICGYKEIGYEWYGSGGYDPFMRDISPTPKSYKFIDTNGNLIVQSD